MKVLKLLLFNEKGHGPIGINKKDAAVLLGVAVVGVATAPIWGPLYLAKKGFDKIKNKIKDKKK